MVSKGIERLACKDAHYKLIYLIEMKLNFSKAFFASKHYFFSFVCYSTETSKVLLN